MARFSQKGNPFHVTVTLRYHEGQFKGAYEVFGSTTFRERILLAMEKVWAERMGVLFNQRQGSWQKLNDKYRQEKINEGYSELIWERTGKVRQAFTIPGGNENKTLRFSHSPVFTKMDIMAGPEIWYWPYVHYGTEEAFSDNNITIPGDGYIPERPWPQIEKNMEGPFQKAVDKVVLSYFSQLKSKIKRNPARVEVFR